MECGHGALTSRYRKPAVFNSVLWLICTMAPCCAQGGAARYGTHPWHWYMTQGLPTVLGPGIAPLALFGIYSAAGSCAFESMGRGMTDSERMRNMATRLQRTELVLAWIAAWVVVLYSTQPHKEFRFVLCTLPMFTVYAGKAMSVLENYEMSGSNQQITLSGTALDVSETASQRQPSTGTKANLPNRSHATRRRLDSRSTSASEPRRMSRSPSHSPHRQRHHADRGKQRERRKMRARWLYAWLVLLNGPLAYYFGRWHQAAPISLVGFRCLSNVFV